MNAVIPNEDVCLTMSGHNPSSIDAPQYIANPVCLEAGVHQDMKTVIPTKMKLQQDMQHADHLVGRMPGEVPQVASLLRRVMEKVMSYQYLPSQADGVQPARVRCRYQTQRSYRKVSGKWKL